MTNLFKEFQPASKEDWIAQITKELKGKSLEENLHYSNAVQEIDYKAYYHQSDIDISQESPNNISRKRGNSQNNNNWLIKCAVQGNSPKELNAFALKELNRGVDALRFDLTNIQPVELSTLLNDIQLEYISTSFTCSTTEQVTAILELIQANPKADIKVFGNTDNAKAYIIQNANQVNRQCIEVSAYDIHAAGGNIIQELAYSLHFGHEELCRLLDNGCTIDQASSKLKFSFGIDANYLLETVKTRVFRALWSHIIQQYSPENSCTTTAYVEMKTGFVNKSLKDPYTNLLRQTTEAMSAVIGGCDELTIQPYDLYATTTDFDFTQRMANNISLLLKEESYFHYVVDPTGGSYALETLTNELSEKAYSLFQELESAENATQFLQSKIATTKQLRSEQFESNSKMLIGVNKYFNPEEISNEWNSKVSNPFGEFIIERDCKTVEA